MNNIMGDSTMSNEIKCGSSAWVNIKPEDVNMKTYCNGVEVGKWQPIETAPKDELLLLYFPESHRVTMGRWFDDKYSKKPRPYFMTSYSRVGTDRNILPTHWMPLPASPEEK